MALDWLIIAEKKSQADKFADALFDKKAPSGSYQSGGRGGKDVSSFLQGEVRIVHFIGHIYEMKMPNEQDPKYDLKQEAKTNRFGMEIGGGYKSTSEMMREYPIELDLDSIEWKLSQSKHRQIASNLKKLYNSASHIIVATDYDNEGEMIYINWQKNNIKKPKWDKMSRLKVNVLTNKAIQDAVQNLIPYVNGPKELTAMRARGFARSISDYEYGLSFSYYGRQFAFQEGSAKGQYGRLKNALLGVVYRHEKQHDDFVDKSSYRVDMVLPNGESLQGNESLVFEKKSDADAYVNSNKLPAQASVDFDEKTVKQFPTKLYARNELIVALNKKHASAIGSGSWNTPLQALYEKHVLLSYPRTDVQYIGTETYKELSNLLKTPSVKQLIEDRIKSVEQKTGLKRDITVDPATPPSKSYVDDSKLDGESHYALVPSENEPKTYSKLSNVEKIVYLEDLTHTMAMFANPAVVVKRAYKSGDLFSANQQRYQTYGYRFLIDDVPENKDKFPDSGVYNVTYKVSEVKAKRPPLFTVSSLLTMMKRVNWGTSATRDSTVDEMVKKGTFKQSKGKLRVNDALHSTVERLLADGLIDFDMTSDWQTALNNIHSDDEAMAFIDDNRKNTKDVHDKFKQLLNV